jgi:hypothetical protein
MRKSFRIVVLLAAAALLAVMAQASSATQGAHFFSASASVNSQGALVLSWDEAGVGQQEVGYSLTINSESAIYACYNNGGNHPQASNKVGPTGALDVSLGTFRPENGRVRVNDFVVTGTPLASTLTCPSGQTERLVQVTYSLGDLTDTTNNVSISLAAFSGCTSFDKKNFPCP